jgi:hypothetical protein
MLKRIVCILFTGLVIAVPPASASAGDESKLSEGQKGKRAGFAPIKATPKRPIPSDETMRCPEWHPLFRKYGLPVQVFSYIAWRESRCRPDAVNATWDKHGRMTYHLNRNKSWDSGLVQVNSSWVRSVRAVCGVNTGDTRRDLRVLLDPECNVRFARWIMDNTKGGLGNWGL